MVSTGFSRRWSAAVAALALLAFAGSACSSGSDDSAADDSTSADVTAAADTPADTAGTIDTAAPADGADTTDSDGDGAGDATAVCGGITAAEVGAAVGAGDFDSADDISVDGDMTCLFTNSTSFYGVSISTEPTDSYLNGELDGITPDEALSKLEIVLTASMDDGATIVRVPVGDSQALIATGTDSILGAGKGTGATVVDGRVIVVDTNGSELSPDPAGFEPIVTNLLALAAAAG